MSENIRQNFNLASMLAFVTQAVIVVVFLTKLDSKASTCVDEIKAIRVTIESNQQHIHSIDVRITRLEERTHVSGDFYDRTKQ